MTETIGFAGLGFNRQVANAVIARRIVSYVAGSTQITPHVGTGNALGVSHQSGNPGDVIQVLEYGIAEVEFDNTPVAGNVATIAGDKAHDSGLTRLSDISTVNGCLGRIARLRPDIGASFADVLVLFPASMGTQIQYGNIFGSPAIPPIPHTGTVVLDFEFSGGGEGGTAVTTVTASWVTAASAIAIQQAGISSADHDPQDAILEGIVASATNIIPGVSFDIQAYAVNDTWGRYTMQYSGA